MSEESIYKEGWAKGLGSLDLHNSRKIQEYKDRTISYRSFCFSTCFFGFQGSFYFAVVGKVTKITSGTFPIFSAGTKKIW